MSIRARALYAAAQVYWRIFKPITLGVRLLMIREDKVLLVKHTYQPEWYLPGGGVKRGERLEAAARREAWEEVGAKIADAGLFGIYSHIGDVRSDHVVVFLCKEFDITGSSDYEIERCEFFPLNDLPAEISIGSKRRILEFMRGERSVQAGGW